MKLLLIITLLSTSISYANNSLNFEACTHHHKSSIDTSKKQNTPPDKVSITSCGCCDEITSTCLTSPAMTSSILIDIKSRKIQFPDDVSTLKRGSAINVKVFNYNPYLYKLNIDNKDSTILARSDGKLLTWFIDPSNLSSLAAGLLSLSITPSGLSGHPLLNPAEKNKYELLPSEKAKSDFLVNTVTFERVNQFSKKEKKGEEIILKYREKVNEHFGNIISLNSEVEKAIYTISKEFDFLNQLYPDCSKFTNLDNTAKNIETAYIDLRNKVQNEKILVTSENNKYLEEFSSVKDECIKNTQIRTGDSLITKLFSESLFTLTKMDSALGYSELKKINASIASIKFLRTCYTSLPLYFSGDSKKISIQLTPWKDSTRLPPYSTSFEIPWNQSKIWGISGGIYLSNLHNNGYSNSASTKNRVNSNAVDTVYNLVNDNPGGGAEFGINALAYYAWKNNNNSFWGISFGAGMSIESKPKARIFLGPEIIFGEKNRLLISPGITVGYVQQLSDAYVGKTDFTAPQTGYMKDFLKCGLYLSIHYSFFSN